MPRLSPPTRLLLKGLVGLIASAFSLVTSTPPAAATHGPDVLIEGGGWGHGIGLSQWGARGFAAQGSSFDAILTHYYQGTAVVPQPAPYDPVRIGLLWDQSAINGSTTDGASVGCSTGGSGSIPAGGFSFVAIDGGALGQVRRSDGSEALRCGGAVTLSYAPGSIRLAGHEYRRGALELSVRPGSSLVRAVALISAVGASPAIDVYLWGLGEMPSSWPSEALKAQATAGRTYALEHVARLGQHRSSPACDCGLVATTSDQAYVGYDKEAGLYGSRWVDAVEATRGLAVTSGGAVIEAFYSSSSGGYTENNELQWGGSPRSFLRGVPDPYDGTGGNPNYRWSVRFGWDDLESRLNADSSTAVGILRTLEIVPPLGVSGRVTVVISATQGGMRITGSAGTKRVSGETIRRVLGLKTNLITLTNLPPGDSKTEPAGGYTLRSDGGLVAFGSAPPPAGAPVLANNNAKAVAIGGLSGVAGYVLDGFGALYPVNGAAGGSPARWDWDIARDVILRRDGVSGYILDGWGGVHPFGNAIPVYSGFYQVGNDLARRFVLRSDGGSGYLVTSNGGVYPFGVAPSVAWTPLPAGRAAQGLILRADGTSGYVVDDGGNLYGFGASGTPPPVLAGMAGTIAVDGRADGMSGYLAAADGSVKAFGGAFSASASTGAASRKDIALIAQPAGYVLDGWGGLHRFGGAPDVTGGSYWSGWDIARRVVVRPDGAGYVMDAYGGLNPFGTLGAPKPAVPSGASYWPGWEIARDVVLLPGDGGSGYVLDGFGGIHPFGGAPPIRATGYWNGWDIARRIALNPTGTGGYVLDGWGGLSPFAIGDNPMPPYITEGSYWPGWDIARDLVLTGPSSGYVVDGWGGVDPFGGASGTGSWYWPGHDLVTGAAAAGPNGSWVIYLDQNGGLHSAPESAPAVDGTSYWPGWPIARDLAT